MEDNLKKKNILKSVLLGLLVGILVGGVGTVSYAMFTYNSSSINNKLVVGDIYM